MSSRPRISLVIPTRERADTLAATLKTCVAQNYPDLEIVVQDNASSPATAQVVASFDDPRIRYYRSERRLSMRANWEAALERTTGDYIVYIGDDDLVLLGGIERLASVIEKTDPDAIKWTSLNYVWPSRSANGGGYITIKHSKVFWDFTEYDVRKVIKPILEGKLRKSMRSFHVYHGCVSRSVIDKARRKTDTYFSYHIPDIYTGFVNMFNSKKNIYIRHPVTSCGHSAHSNGMSFYEDQTVSSENAAEVSPYVTYLNEIESDKEVPYLYNPHFRAMTYHGLICLDIANKLFGSGRQVNLDAWIRHALAETVADPFYLTEAHKANVIYEVDRLLIERLPPAPEKAPSSHRDRTSKHGARRSLTKLDVPTALEGEDDSYTAAMTLSKLLDTGYDVAPRGALSDARHFWHWALLQRRAGAISGRG